MTLSKAIRFDSPGKVSLVDQAIAPPSARDVTVETEISLISAGTERSFLLHAPHYPVFPGYSVVGRITRLGEAVPGFAIGDRVIADGPHASLINCDYRRVCAIGEDVSAEHAAFFSVAGMAIHAVRLAKLNIGDPLLILGQGLIGLIATQIARLAGAVPITVVDVVGERLALARKLGADSAFLASESEALKAWLSTMPGGGPATTIDLSGVPSTVDLAVEVTRRQGRIVNASLAPQGYDVNIFGRTWLEGITIVGSYYNARPWQLDATETTSPYDWPVRLVDPVRHVGHGPSTGRGEMDIFLALLANGRLDLGQIISEALPLDQAVATFEGLAHATGLGYLIRWT
ncbi:zinc-dependent alcohol dehydrogenase [Aquisediminimonas profunda]|uniref:zinc-dependent alcohol dehydrogenase n=1 Tax=Aquisediminimonas profunda TaxID=1550733 RepID=UPI001C62C467|nr:zinc-binding alcohol dehydrogenase [Aquisediminimonas profunda]